MTMKTYLLGGALLITLSVLHSAEASTGCSATTCTEAKGYIWLGDEKVCVKTVSHANTALAACKKCTDMGSKFHQYNPCSASLSSDDIKKLCPNCATAGQKCQFWCKCPLNDAKGRRRMRRQVSGLFPDDLKKTPAPPKGTCAASITAKCKSCQFEVGRVANTCKTTELAEEVCFSHEAVAITACQVLDCS